MDDTPEVEVEAGWEQQLQAKLRQLRQLGARSVRFGQAQGRVWARCQLTQGRTTNDVLVQGELTPLAAAGRLLEAVRTETRRRARPGLKRRR